MGRLLLGLAAWLLMATASLAEAPASYRVRASLGPATDALSAEVDIRLFRDRAGSEYRFLLGRSFTVSHIEAEGATVRVEPTDQPFPGVLQAFVVTPDPAASGDIRIRTIYSGTLTQAQQPPINSVSQDLIELSVDSFWLPIPQDLNAGVVAEAEFTGVPRDAAVASTGEVTREGDVVRISLTRPNDLTLTASPLLKEVREAPLTFYAVNPDSEAVRAFRRHGPTGIAYLEGLLGPRPGGDIAVVVAPRESKAGYNRPGYIVVGDRPADTAEYALGGSLIHELAHTWWSKANFLTEDYWLVEGPAEYLTWRYGQATFGDELARRHLARNRATAENSGSVIGRGRPSSRAYYYRSMVLLVGLEERIGRERMDALLRRYVGQETHTTATFLTALSEIAGPEVSADFEARLRSQAL